MLELNRLLNQIQPSITLEITALARRLRAEGRNIITLSAGEPDFDTPEPIKQAAIKAIQSGQSKYTAVDGTPELKQAIVDKLKRDNHLDYTTTEVCATVGAKQGCYNLCQVLLNPGDEVIIPAPYWVSYPDLVLLAQAKPVIIPCAIEQNYKLTPEQLSKHITEHTRLLILNSPSNPSGAIYSDEEWLALAEVLRQHPKVTLLSDDIYEHILMEGSHFSNILNVAPDLKARTAIVNGVSKAYAMTGWRLGFVAADPTIIKALVMLQGQSTSNPCSIAQAAAAEALGGDQSCLLPMVEAFRRRHNLLYDTLKTVKGFRIRPSDGSFYFFIHIEEAIRAKGLKDDVTFCSVLLENQGVATVPGSGFGLPGHMRLSFALSDEALMDAAQRFHDFMA